MYRSPTFSPLAYDFRLKRQPFLVIKGGRQQNKKDMGILKTVRLENLMNHLGDRIVLPLFAFKHENFHRVRTVCDLLDEEKLNFHLFLGYFRDAGKFLDDLRGNRTKQLFLKPFKSKKRQDNSFFLESETAVPSIRYLLKSL